jgi:hypothetical protein
MNRDSRQSADRCDAFLCAPEIESALQTQAAENFDIGLRDMAEMVGAKDLPPTHRAPVAAAIAAEVAEIAGAGEIEVAGGIIRHGAPA